MTKTDRCEQEFMSVCFRYNGELFFSYWEKIIVLKEIFFCHDVSFCDFLGESFAFSDYSCIFAVDMGSIL